MPSQPATERYSPLRALRKRKDVSQRAVAEAIGVAQQVYAKWENGTAPIPESRLAALEDYFGSSLSSPPSETRDDALVQILLDHIRSQDRLIQRLIEEQASRISGAG